jgi:hypothetical protein
MSLDESPHDPQYMKYLASQVVFTLYELQQFSAHLKMVSRFEQLRTQLRNVQVIQRLTIQSDRFAKHLHNMAETELHMYMPDLMST